ncbi:MULTISPECIES: ABC transporter substrate-binding protein [Sphingomonas]|uniref:ABC transporter substrate-binding protein n=1 Tax=Sphingomonas TaxID=13687 RepID=UPI000DEF7D67|nr:MULTISPECIES: ABC transporter substrate-binding protein [Sphingomonas]
MAAFALAFASAVRVASLNLCTDELVLALAEPRQIASLSYLAGEPGDSARWAEARRYPRNRGTLDSALAARPNLVLTMGGAGRATAEIAARLGMRVVVLPFPQSVADVRGQVAQVGALLGQQGKARQLVGTIDRLRASAPPPADGAFIGGSGTSLAPGSLGAEWLALAGYRQRALPNARLSLEALVTSPPKWLIRSDYRSGEASRQQAWFDHPLVRRLAARTTRTDGRAWTCGGVPMLAEVARLRRAPH